MFNHVLIQKTGGSGGNTLSWFLNQHLGLQRGYSHDHRGRIVHIDQFDTAFTNAAPTSRHREAYGLPNTQWRRMDHALIDQFIWMSRADYSKTKTGLINFNIAADFDIKSHFTDTFVISLVPSTDNFWLITALRLVKDACRKMNWIDREMDINVYPSRQFMLEFYDNNGWIPAWWMWFEREQIGKFDSLLDDIPLVTAEKLLVKTSSDCVMEAGQFVTDRSLESLRDICDTLGIETLQDNAVAVVESWVDKNINLLDKLGISQYIGNKLDMTAQRQILRDTFLPIHEQLVAEDWN
jgi:hypothetical protein